MRARIEHLSAPPDEYSKVYFANLVRALEGAFRRIDYVPEVTTIPVRDATSFRHNTLDTLPVKPVDELIEEIRALKKKVAALEARP